MKVRVINADGVVRANSNGKPSLMHGVDAQNAIKGGNYKGVFEETTMKDRDNQPIVKQVLVGIQEMTDDDRKKAVAAKKVKLKKAAQAIEKEEAALDKAEADKEAAKKKELAEKRKASAAKKKADEEAD